MSFSFRHSVCYNKEVKGTRWGILWGTVAALFLSLPSAAIAGQTIDDLFSHLQKSFAAKDKTAYLNAFVLDIRDGESAMVSSFMDLWKMDKVLFHRANRTEEKESDAGEYLQVLYENEYSAMLEVWHVWIQKTDDRWHIRRKEITGAITTLYKIRIPSDRVERASVVEIRHEDIRITFQNAWIFYDNLPNIETALIVLGKGEFHFSPSSDMEKHQLDLRYKRNFIEDKLEYAYLRFGDSFFQNNITIKKAPAEKTPPLSQAEANRAYSLFTKYYPASFTVENSLTGDLLSFIPQGEQVLFELNSGDSKTLAYIYSPFNEEEIHMLQRNPEKIINLYSPEKEGERGKKLFISFGQKFDVQRYDLEVDFQPEKLYLSARANIQVYAQIDSLESLKFNFNSSLDILRVYDEEGRELFYTQDKLRKLLYVYFLRPLDKGKSGSIEIYYRGKLDPPAQTADVLPGGQYNETVIFIPPRFDSYLYSQSAFWYPAPSDEDYFQASLRITVPPDYICVTNGALTEQRTLDSVRRGTALEKVGNSLFGFETKFPVKYLTFIAGKFTKFPNDGGPGSPDLQGFASADVRIMRRGLLEEARAILLNYEKWFGAYPYEKLSVIQRLWPTSGGHSPASFVILNELPRTLESPSTVNSDSPVDLSRWKEYFIAHEIAHQWWGQAVTGERYHDQWLSEGLAQFAAVYYLKEKLGERVYAGILKRFSQWAKKKSPWGPITLGSRLSYLDFIAYQAVVYNKSAVALNMLLDLLGEETFFKGLQEFFKTYKYRSARTTHFIRTMEQTSGRNLKPFFSGWFDSHGLPEVYVTHTVQKQADDFVLKFKVSQPKDAFVFPLWVEWEENGEKVRRKLEVDAASQEFEFRTAVKPTKVKVNPDRFVPGDFK